MNKIRNYVAASFFITVIFLSIMFTSCAAPSLLAPSIKIVAPPGNIYAVGDVAVSVDTNNFTITDKQAQANTEGQGHLHYFLDVDAPTILHYPVDAPTGTWTSSAATSYTWHNVGRGSHTISVELVNNDDSPLDPPVVSTMVVTVVPELGTPQAVILSPRDGASLSTGNVTVSIEVDDFNLVEQPSDPPVSNEGHLLYFFDVEAPTNPGDPALTDNDTYASDTATSHDWSNVAPGRHIFSIELVNDDNTPLTPAVVASISITVSSP
jgi:hypothetical protein